MAASAASSGASANRWHAEQRQVRRLELATVRVAATVGERRLVDAAVDGVGAELGRQLARVVAAGGPDVVRYRSRAEARAELVVAVVAGDRGRAWAWRQVGLWPSGDLVQIA